jgi:hypothetical protein
VLVFGALALGLLALGLVANWPAPLGPALMLLGAEYAVHFAAYGDSLDKGAPVYAAGLVLTAELAYWSLEPPRVAAWTEYGLLLRRLAHLVAVCSAAAALAALVIVVAASGGGGGVALEAVGAAAAVGAVAVVAVLVRRSALR